MRTFRLVRDEDISGISGTGEVAHGVQFPSGRVALEWRGPHSSIVIWQSLDSVLAIHGHGGATRVEWNT